MISKKGLDLLEHLAVLLGLLLQVYREVRTFLLHLDGAHWSPIHSTRA